MALNITRYHLGCHGIPERCLVIGGRRMRICARCVGSNIGHIIAVLLVLLGTTPPLWLAAVMIIIMLIDWSLQAFINIPSTNVRRVLTGVLGGTGMGLFIWSGILFCFQVFISIL